MTTKVLHTEIKESRKFLKVLFEFQKILIWPWDNFFFAKKVPGDISITIKIWDDSPISFSVIEFVGCLVGYRDMFRESLKVAKLKWTGLTSRFGQQVSKSVDELKWILLLEFYLKFSVLFDKGLKKRLMRNFRHLRTRQYQKSRTKSAKSKEIVTNFHTFS